jgi:predicted acylesterase/phospholipase RssA
MKSTTEGEYQVVSGIALGAINAHIFSQFPKGQEVQAADKLVDFWTKIAETKGSLTTSWSWGMVYGFFYENSIYDA